MSYVRPAKTKTFEYDMNLYLSLKYPFTVKLLIEHHLEFLCLKRGCTDSSESIYVQMPHCWKSHVAAKKIYIQVQQTRVKLELNFSNC